MQASSNSNSTTIHLRNDGQSINMKDLISFDMGFNKLGLVLSDIVGRLQDLEDSTNDCNYVPGSAASVRFSGGAPRMRYYDESTRGDDDNDNNNNNNNTSADADDANVTNDNNNNADATNKNNSMNNNATAATAADGSASTNNNNNNEDARNNDQNNTSDNNNNDNNNNARTSPSTVTIVDNDNNNNNNNNNNNTRANAASSARPSSFDNNMNSQRQRQDQLAGASFRPGSRGLTDLARRLEELENKVDGISKKQDDIMGRSARGRSLRNNNAGGASTNNNTNLFTEDADGKTDGDNNGDDDGSYNNNDYLHGAIDELNEKIQDLTQGLDDARVQAKKALSRAGDAEHLAENVGDRLDSHVRFAHANNNNNDGSSPSALDNNNNTSQQPDSTTRAPEKSQMALSTNPQELAEEQHRLQSAIDRLAKQGREHTDAIDGLGSQFRSFQRQQLSTPTSRGGAGGTDSLGASVSGYSKPMIDLSKRISALEEESRQNNNASRSSRSRPSSSPQEGDDNGGSSSAFQQQLDDALDKIRGQLTTHDVAIEDLQNQNNAMLNNLGSSANGGDGGGVPKDVLTAAVTSLQNRVKNAEENVKDHSEQLRDLSSLKKTAADRQKVEELAKNLDYESKAAHNMHEKLNDRMDAVENKLKNHLDEPKHVDEAEFERLQDDVRRLEKDLLNVASSGGGGGGGSGGDGKGLSEMATNMINGRIDALHKTVDANTDKLNELESNLRNLDNQLGDANNNIKQNASKIQSVEGMVRRVADETSHASHDARSAGEAVDGILKRLSQLGNGQDQINDRLNQVDHSVTTLAAHNMSGRGGLGGSINPNATAPSSKFEELLRADVDKLKKWQQTQAGLSDLSNNLKKNLEADRESNKSQMVDVRAIIDHIHHTKADASQVASKADRDYVENALEKLMREVENVINSTNAGLIDTLDKSLGLLRDMIDGKATKQDVAKVRNLIGASDVMGASGINNNNNTAANSMNNNSGTGSQVTGGDNAPVFDGLMGVYSYRCLGCNRTVEGMRARPMGSTMSNFMARNAPTGGSTGSGVGGGGSSTSQRAGTPRTTTSGNQQQQAPLLIPAPPSSTPK